MGLSAPLGGGGPICPLFGKDTFSKGRAKKVAKTMQRRGGGNVQAYLCRSCGGWHVGMTRKF